MSLAAEETANLRQKLDTGLAAFEANRIGEAAQIYRQIIDEIPRQPDALHMLGVIAYRMGRTDLALALYPSLEPAVHGEIMPSERSPQDCRR